jgi:outer membrane protein insertion porin family
MRWSPDAVRRGIRKLFALGLFEDVYVEQLPRGEQVDLVIHVVERRRIGRIEFSGNRRLETTELEKKLVLRPGEPFLHTTVQSQVDSLLKYYREEGYARATIEAQEDTIAGSPREVLLRFAINEGEKVRITKIVFQGNTQFAEVALRKALGTKQKGFFGGGEIDEEKLREDEAKLAAYFHDHGYRDAQVTARELKPGKGPRDLTLVFTIEPGPRYVMGSIDWIGNTVIPGDNLRRFWAVRRGEVYDRSKIQRTQGQAFGEYAELGYLYLNVEPRETVRGDTVDVTFFVSEGRPSNIRMVQITGNRGTREKVIRRELDVHEGDRFRRSQLVRSQGDVMRLGFFEDVGIDFSPAESTDVDIILKVKEKQVGTASAGAGYTAEGGITGFLELGHNNVLGNGQSLSLHLERGARRSDYFLSFTEPWFRDTPTLLGFSIFNTDRERDLYDERRVGGSARIGRPLPWPDYTRGTVSYRIEDVIVEVDTLTSGATPEQRVVLQGINSGEAARTSAVELNFMRNSTDNPFYPTKGSRGTLEIESAGGPWGGSVNFFKSRFEVRGFFPSVVPRFTTMLRARFGLLSQYADQHQPVPDYERFRLGGGTTPDPLRGYDDYQIVPQKFVQEVRDSVGRLIDVVRYPGGRYMTLLTFEQQFAIAHPLHGVLFFDAGNTWDRKNEIWPMDLKLGAGFGLRIEIPLLGNMGFDYGYGFDRDDGPRWAGHFLIGQTFF